MPPKSKTFFAVNFGCRVNAAETNLWSQQLINQGYCIDHSHPNIILVNTCAVTKKGEYESLSKVKQLRSLYPDAEIRVTGCANLNKIQTLTNVKIYSNHSKEKLLSPLNSAYQHQIKDKFSQTNRYLLKIQSGCTHFCSYCTVPLQRPYLWSLPIDTAIQTVHQAILDGYNEIIITGINIDQYQYGLSNLVLALLKGTTIPLISFGSVPLNSIDQQFINLYKNPHYQLRLSSFLHIPLQSGSDKILKLMNRHYTKKEILKKFSSLKKISPVRTQTGVVDKLTFGTDIIVGFPTETDTDFQKTYDLCQQINFTKIHTFRFSPRPQTTAKILHQQSPKISLNTLTYRSQKIRSLISQTTLPSRQKPEN